MIRPHYRIRRFCRLDGVRIWYIACARSASDSSISANIAAAGPKYVEGCERGGRAADPTNWRVAKSVFVANDTATAKAYATDPDGPYVNYYRWLFTKLKKNGRIELFKSHREQPDDEVTFEMVCDKLIIYGSPEGVADQLLTFQDQVGTFGTLLYAGKDWKERALGRQSMILTAEKVLPRVIAGSRSRATAAE